MLRTIRATILTQQLSDPKLISSDDNTTALKVFFIKTHTDVLESSIIDYDSREEIVWLSDLHSHLTCNERVRELLHGLLPPDSPSNAFFANLLAGIACPEAQLGFGIGSVEVQFNVDTCTPQKPNVCMLCLKEYTLEDVVVHHRRCKHHSHRRCSGYFEENNVDCVVCSHDIKVIERIHVSIDGEKFDAEITKFS